MIRGLVGTGLLILILIQFQADVQSFADEEPTPYPTWNPTQRAIYQTESIEAFERFIQHDEICQWPCIAQLAMGESNRDEVFARLESPGFALFLENSANLGSDGFYDSYYAYGGAFRLTLMYRENGLLESVDLVASQLDTPDWVNPLSENAENLSFSSVLEAIDETPQIYLTHGHPDRLSLRMVFPETGMQIDGTFDMEWDGENSDWVEGTPLCFGIDNMTYFRAEIRNLQLGERFDYEPEPSSSIRLIDEYDWLPASADFEEALLAAGDDGCLPLMGRGTMTSTPTPTSIPTPSR